VKPHSCAMTAELLLAFEHQALGARHSASGHIGVGGLAERPFEGATEVAGAAPGDPAQILDVDGVAEMVVDVDAQALHLPSREFARAAVRLLGGLVPLELMAQQRGCTGDRGPGRLAVALELLPGDLEQRHQAGDQMDRVGLECARTPWLKRDNRGHHTSIRAAP